MVKNLNIKAMKLAMAKQIHDQIKGVFGADDSDECIAKLHSIIELAASLNIKNLNITITLKELTKSQEEYSKTVNPQEEE